jgi:hypothetical protein
MKPGSGRYLEGIAWRKAIFSRILFFHLWLARPADEVLSRDLAELQRRLSMMSQTADELLPQRTHRLSHRAEGRC